METVVPESRKDRKMYKIKSGEEYSVLPIGLQQADKRPLDRFLVLLPSFPRDGIQSIYSARFAKKRCYRSAMTFPEGDYAEQTLSRALSLT